MRYVVLAIGLLLAACAPLPSSGYAPEVRGYGYREEPMEGGRIAVAFTGNQQTPRETVEAYALYRAAEVTQAQGRARFALIDKTVLIRTFEEPLFSPSIALGGSDPFFGTGPSSTLPPPVRPITNYGVTLIVQPFVGQPPEGTLRVLDAAQVLAEIGPSLSD